MAITLAAKATGAAGNSISLTWLPNNLTTPNLTLTITVVGTAITAQGATNGAGLITSTEAQVVAALNANPQVSALVTASTNNPTFVMLAGGGQQFLQGGSGGTGGGYAGLDPGNFKILLLDSNQIQVSNIPLLWSNLIHVPQTAPNLLSTAHSSSIPENFWPTPPMLYRKNSSIRFFIYVTSATPLAAGSTWDFNFSGVRRYNCK